MSLRSLLTFLILIAFCRVAEAQHSIEFNSISGFKVFSPGNYALSGMSHGGELAFNFSQTHKSDEWVRRLHITDISLVGGFHNMRSVQIADSVASKGFLQSVFTVSGRLNHKLYEIGRFSMSLTAGLGLAYSTSSYFTDENPIVGSKLNFSPQGGLKLAAAVTPDLSLAAAANIFHYSNAAIRVPNKGVNSFQASVGISYKLPFRDGGKLIESDLPKDSVRRFFEFAIDAGRRGAWKSTGGNWKSGLSVHYHYPLNNVVNLKAGTDLVYYYTTFDGSEHRYQYLATSYDPIRAGISLGSDIWLGKLVVGANFGYYLKYNSFHPVKTYRTGTLKYYLTRGIGVQSKLYFHRAQADYMGFGVVFRR